MLAFFQGFSPKFAFGYGELWQSLNSSFCRMYLNVVSNEASWRMDDMELDCSNEMNRARNILKIQHLAEHNYMKNII